MRKALSPLSLWQKCRVLLILFMRNPVKASKQNHPLFNPLYFRKTIEGESSPPSVEPRKVLPILSLKKWRRLGSLLAFCLWAGLGGEGGVPKKKNALGANFFFAPPPSSRVLASCSLIPLLYLPKPFSPPIRLLIAHALPQPHEPPYPLSSSYALLGTYQDAL